MSIRIHSKRLKTAQRLGSCFGWGSLSLLGLITFSLLSPHCYNDTYANDVTSRAIITPSVSIAMTEPGSIYITPSGDGQFGAVSSKLQVATTNSAGYSIYLNTLDQTNAMVNVNGNNKLSIQAIDSEQRPSDFKANTWGFALTRGGSNTGESPVLTNLLYQPTPTASSLVTSIPRATETDTYTLAFGANIDTSLPAGQYANTVLVSVVANPQTIRTLSDLTYMQEMSTLSCENSSLHETKQLIDLRDNKDYWVAKLADGNCWMTQNLALDLNEKTLPLKPETSDVSGEWRPESYTETSVPNKETYSDQQFWKTRSWNLGKFILATPTRIVSCNTAPVSGSNFDDGTVSAYSRQSIGQNCSNLVDVSGVNWQSTFDSAESPDGTWSGTNYNSTTKKVESYTYTGPLAVNKNTSEYDAHYLIGNFYQWNAAVAGTGGADVASTGAEKDASKLAYANDSICPKGWKLPRTARDVPAGTPFNMNNLGFHWLTHMYGYPDNGFPNEPTITDDGIDSWKMSGGQLVTKLKTGIAGTGAAGVAHEDVTLSPIYITRSGTVDVVNGIYRGSGYWVFEWSTVANGNNQAAYQWFLNGDYITPAHANARQGGFNVRCLAK